MPTLGEIFPDSKTLLALPPEELGAVLMEVLPSLSQQGDISWWSVEHALYPDSGPALPGYDRHYLGAVIQALTEALSWLETQGLIVRKLGQANDRWVITRRGRELKTRVDVSTYMHAQSLPVGLLQPELRGKVLPLFLRGDYETAVFQAFKLVETDVRRASKLDFDEVGVRLMRRAFNPENGPLTLKAAPEGEKEAVSALFAGAIGYAKNPASHRDVPHTRESAARLILFASELLEIVFVHEIIG